MTEQDFYQLIADEQKLRAIQVAHTVELLDDGNTVPFIARYRKEATGSLDEEKLRVIEERIKYLRTLEERKQTILKSIDEQGKLTPELESQIRNVLKLQDLEDLYLPYKPKKRTRATVARERGLEPLAELILQQEIEEGDPEEYAKKFVDPEKEVSTPVDALIGAMDIVAEIISDNAEVRKRIRRFTRDKGIVVSKAKKPEESSDFEMYYDFAEKLKRLVPHRTLALNRGEKEKILSVSIDVEEDRSLGIIEKLFVKNPQCIFLPQMKAAIKDSFKRLVFPAIERELRNELTGNAEEHAIRIFTKNLRSLLLQPPVRGKMIMGIDPGYRTGCKVAVIDQTGKYLTGDTIYPHPPQNKIFESKTTLRQLIDQHNIDIIAIGNGTASRETESLVADLIGEIKDTTNKEVFYLIVNEAGASVYSASKVAKEEFPELDASMRGNISIARRLLDPLAELVKIDPKHIGVGLYQHDVTQSKLNDALDKVIESAVNLVGVDLNTASVSLLQNVSGLNSASANNIVKFRDENGMFKTREELKEIKGIGDMAFEQSAGFLRIPEGDNPLDNTGIHPESYEATKRLLEIVQLGKDSSEWRNIRNNLNLNPTDLAQRIGVGEPTLKDILLNLEKPGRDPRDEMPKPVFKSDVLSIEDLREGMVLKGTVRNVVDFGAFVDIGVKNDGLVHISNMSQKYIKNPLDVVSVGDVISVKILGIDPERGRINLSMII
jgi:uncharacterized protein